MTHNTLPHIILPDSCSIGEVVEKLQVAFLQPIELFLPQIIQPTYFRERSQTAIIIILSESFWFFHTAKVHDCFLWWLSWHKITSMAQLEKIRRQNPGLWLWLITVFFNMRFNSTYKGIFEFFHNLCLLRKLVLFRQNIQFYTPSSAWTFIACLAESFQNGTWVHIQLLFCSCHFIFSEWKKMAYLELQLTILHSKTILWNTSFSLKMFRLEYL